MNNFDWSSYFLNRDTKVVDKDKAGAIVAKVRDYLKEDEIKIAFALTRMMRRLMGGVNLPENLKVLELGAATGFLSRWFLNEYGGKATLVDNNKASYEEFLKNNYNTDSTNYIIGDAFNLRLSSEFSIVCSFGLIEHFRDKRDIVKAHLRPLEKDGYLVILVPKDSFLTRVYFDIHPELNCGYRELLKEEQLEKILLKNGLKVVNCTASDNYVYDFIGAVCKINS